MFVDVFVDLSRDILPHFPPLIHNGAQSGVCLRVSVDRRGVLKAIFHEKKKIAKNFKQIQQNPGNANEVNWYAATAAALVSMMSSPQLQPWLVYSLLHVDVL